MKWKRENIGRVCLIMAIIFFLVTASVSSYRAGSEDERTTAAELSLQQLTAAVQTPFSGMWRNIGQFFKDLVSFREYARENEELRKENAELKQSLSESQMSQEQLEQLQQLSESLSYVDHSSDFKKVAANVLSLDRSGVYGILTISAGESSGIHAGDVVTSARGMVGRVISASERSSKVSGIINSSVSVSFYIKGHKNTIGVVTGNGKNGLTGYLLDDNKRIEEGAVLLTSGLGRYPAGIEIGTVTSVNKDKTTSQVNIDAVPSVDFYSVGTVAVLAEN